MNTKCDAALIPVNAFECNDDASMDSIIFYDMAANLRVEEDASSSKHNSRLRATDYLILQFSVHGSSSLIRVINIIQFAFGNNQLQ